MYPSYDGLERKNKAASYLHPEGATAVHLNNRARTKWDSTVPVHSSGGIYAYGQFDGFVSWLYIEGWIPLFFHATLNLSLKVEGWSKTLRLLLFALFRRGRGLQIHLSL